MKTFSLTKEQINERLLQKSQDNPYRKYIKAYVLTRQETLDVYNHFQSMLRDAYRRLDKINYQFLDDETLVEMNYISDMILIKYGVTSEILNKAILDHDLTESQEF